MSRATRAVGPPAGEDATLDTPGPRGAPARRNKRGIGSAISKLSVAWTLLAPLMVILVVFTALPALVALVYSLTDIGAGDMREPFNVEFVGFDTFVNVLSNAEFRRSLGTTAVMVVVGVLMSMAVGLALALALDKGIRRLRSTFRSLFYIPVVVNVVAAAVIWQYAFTLDGQVNVLLRGFGLDGPNWLGEPDTALATVILLAVWRNIGTCMVLFLAGLQSIPHEVYEAAAVDGAPPWKRLTHITLPLLQPATLLVTVLMTVSYMNIFDEPYLLTKGGPVGSTRSVALWVYQQFGHGNIAEAMAGSYVLLAIIMVFTFVQLRLMRARA